MSLLAPFKKQSILALLRYYQNILDMISTADSFESRQIYIDFWRLKFADYRAYPTLFTKEPLRLAIQKHHLPIDLFLTFLTAAETSFLRNDFTQKQELYDEVESLSRLTSVPLAQLIWLALDYSIPIDADFCVHFGRAISLLSFITQYPDLIEKQDIYTALFQARSFLLSRPHPSLTLFLGIIESSMKLLKKKDFPGCIPKLGALAKVKMTVEAYREMSFLREKTD